MKRHELTQDRLKKVLYYNPDTGIFTRRIVTSNRIKIGDVAGSLNKTLGYWYISFNAKSYLAHRLAWFYMTGEWPENEIDHINCDKSDNRFCNLREATRSQNLGNTRTTMRNISGYKGVYWNDERKKYQVTIKIYNKPKYLGRFDCPAAASFAYQIAANKHFGEFARTK